MAGVESDRRSWIPFLLGIAITGLAVWLVVGMGGDSAPDGRGSGVIDARNDTGGDDDPSRDVRVPELRIAPGGRLIVAEKDLPTGGDLAVVLELSDEARGDGPRSVRIVSASSSGRLGASAVPLPGSGSGMRLDVERAFLSRGLYMIEVDTADHHPLKLRRYVLEIQ